MKFRNKMIGALALATMTAALCIGGTAAYLTDSENVSNDFTIGKVDIELEEPSWKPEENTSLVPQQEIKKDPQVKNKSTGDIYTYLEVSVPVRNVVTADASGKKNQKKPTELLSFKSSSDWTLIESSVKQDNKIYIYSYNKILKPQETTSPLFEKMTFANLVEGQLDGSSFSVPVHAFAIQTSNTSSANGTIPERAKEAYQKYLNQNPGTVSASSGS